MICDEGGAHPERLNWGRNGTVVVYPYITRGYYALLLLLIGIDCPIPIPEKNTRVLLASTFFFIYCARARGASVID